jgi:hypothetical protein
MSGKSRHGKGKRFHYSKKSKALRRQEAAAAASPATAGAPEIPRPVAPATTPPIPKAAVATAKGTVNPYPYIGRELRRIAIFGGIIIVILVILVVILS